jgi:hypothetical protein
MKLTKYRLNKILNTNNKQTRKKRINKDVKLSSHNTTYRKKKQFNLRNTTLKHF